jgi:tetratricopeptide (TPR) repeat protein
MEQLLLVPGLALAFAFRSMATLGTPPDSRVAVDSLIQSIASTLLTLGGWLSIPWPLTTTMTIYNTDFRPQLWLGALVTGLVLLRLLRQAPLRASALLGMAALAFAPALGGISWYGTLGERYLYLPMVALASLLAAELPDWSGKLLLPWSIGALGILLVRLPDWDSSESLWQAAVTRAPDAYSYQLQASEFYRQGRYPEALATYEHSLNLRPTRLFACTYITSTAIEVLSLDDLLARLPSWEASGCRTIQGFDTPAVMAMAAAGRWINAEAWLRSAHQVDPKKRDRIIKGAIALVDGDLLMLGGEYVIWKGSPSDYLDKVYSYTNNRKIRP